MEVEKYKMIYKIDKNNGNSRILGELFVKNNKNKLKLIINNKQCKLKDIISIKNIKGDKFKIKVISCNNIFNKSFMFKDCISLIQIKLLDNLYVKNNILFEDKNVGYIKIHDNKENNYYQIIILKYHQ